jgi:hypothetical protein
MPESIEKYINKGNKTHFAQENIEIAFGV